MSIIRIITKYFIPKKLKNTSLYKFLKNTYYCPKDFEPVSNVASAPVHTSNSIYPIEIPSFDVPAGLDLLLIEMPSRYMPFIPNSMGYLDIILKKTQAKFFILDANIIFYHRYHSRRIEDVNNCIKVNGEPVIDPWTPGTSFLWDEESFISEFDDWIEELHESLIKAAPRCIGLSVSETNRTVSNKLIKVIRERLPETKIEIGGYDCYHHTIGPKNVPDFDYMFIGESELTMPPFIEKLLNNEECIDMPGIISKLDRPDREWVSAPLEDDLEGLGYPKYEWTDLSLYRDFTGFSLIPICGSRGCSWGRCRFCGERIKWRQRGYQDIFDEILFFYQKGYSNFHFNESDFNGDPVNLIALCNLIIEKKIDVHFFGQLRIDRRLDFDFFKTLREAGCSNIRFGVDGWCDDTLKLQRKGYNMKIVESVLSAAKKAGMYVSTNIVLGMPGETEEMIDESIENIVQLEKYIDIVESINTLLLNAGSCYYSDPDEYKIKFRGDKEEIYSNNAHIIPTELWYSDEPYIDQKVRNKRLEKICVALDSSNIILGDFAKGIISKTLKEES